MQVSRGFKSHPVRYAVQDPSEGWQNGNAPVSKTGVLTDFRVRIPAPPLYLPTTYEAAGYAVQIAYE